MASKPGSARIPTKLVYTVVAVGLSAILLYFSLRGLNWKQVGAVLARADLRYILLWILIGNVTLFLRAMRWRILLSSGGLVSASTAFWATVAGYFGNNYLPARAGEVIRTVLVSAKTRLTKTFVLTTALSERLSDGVALVLISSIVLLTLPTRPGWFDQAARPFAIVGLAGGLAIAVTPLLEPLLVKLIARLPGPENVRGKIGELLSHVLKGMRAFHSPQRLASFLGMTCVIWLGDAIGVVIGMRALHLHGNLAIALLLNTGLGLGSALPSTPGYVGIYQFVAVSVLTPFGFSKADAIAFILLAQALQYLITGFWGMLAFSWARDMNLKQLWRASEPDIVLSPAVPADAR
jgi:uncharacterized protein (TIRG00374 family)